MADDRDLHRNLIGRQPIPEVLDKLCGGCRFAQFDHRDRELAQPGIGAATTAAPTTAGWDSSAARTSSGRTLKPPRMMA